MEVPADRVELQRIAAALERITIVLERVYPDRVYPAAASQSRAEVSADSGPPPPADTPFWTAYAPH